MLNEPASESSTENSNVKSDSQIDVDVESNNVNMQEVPSSSNQLLLTTCLPTTVPTFALNSVSSTINLLETSNTCSNAEVSSLESVGENPESDKMEEAETQFNLNLPVRMAADSTSVEEPEAFSSAESPLPAEELADASPSLAVSPAPSSEDLKDPSPIEEDTTVEDPESSCSMNIADPDFSPLVKDEITDDSNENSATPSEHVTSRDSASFNSNCEIAETNVVSSSLQKDTSCLPSDCLDSDSSSLQQSFNVSFYLLCCVPL